MVNRRLIAGVLFILTAIIHLLYPFLYGINNSTIGCAVFGIIYLALGILQYNNKVWVIWISIILPALGLLVSLIDYFSSSFKPSIYPLLALIDVGIIVILIIELIKSTSKSKNLYK